jgi:23S rRNA pseudouridine1911/1915/1917 synthase
MPDASRSQAAIWIKEGRVEVNGEVQTKTGFDLKPEDEVVLELPEGPEPLDLEPVDIDFGVVYEDDQLVVVNKPRGLATHPALSLKEPTLVNALLHRYSGLSEEGGAFRPGIVHRLDKETTGLLVVARNDVAHRKLAAQIESKTAERRYLAVTRRRPDQTSFKVEAPIGRHPKDRKKMAVVASGRAAATYIRLLHEQPGACLLGARLETGRTHQIRVHLAAVGLPVLGDPVYGEAGAEYAMQLHAAYLEVEHPQTGKRMAWYCEPPEDFLLRDNARAIEEWQN